MSNGTPDLEELFRREPMPRPPPEASARVLARVNASVAAGGVAVIGASAMKLAAITFIVGAAVGGSAVAILRTEPAPRVVYVDRVVPPPASVSPSAVSSEDPPIASATHSAEAPRQPVVVSSAPRDSLGSERALLDEARTRLAAGEAERALRHLEEHARSFPHPVLGEESEALAVQALVNAGRFGEARTRGAAFSARWPASVYEPAVKLTLESIP